MRILTSSLTFASVVAVGGALRLESLAVSSRRNAIALGATALVTPLAGRAFDLPALEEFDDTAAAAHATSTHLKQNSVVAHSCYIYV